MLHIDVYYGPSVIDGVPAHCVRISAVSIEDALKHGRRLANNRYGKGSLGAKVWKVEVVSEATERA